MYSTTIFASTCICYDTNILHVHVSTCTVCRFVLRSETKQDDYEYS